MLHQLMGEQLQSAEEAMQFGSGPEHDPCRRCSGAPHGL